MPAKDSIVIRMSAEDAGVFEAWQKAKKGPEAMGDAIRNATEKGKKHTDEFSESLGKMVGQWAAAALSIQTAKQMMADFYATKRGLEQQEAGASAAADSALRKYFVTAKIGDAKQQAASTQRIGAVALRQKTSLPSAGSAANMLSQFGVSRQEAEGGTLEELLQLQQATSAGGGDPEEISRRVLDIIRRSTPGGKVSKGAIRDVGGTMRKLTSAGLGFNDTSVDMYAKYATNLKEGGYDTATAMALTAAVTEKYDARQARPFLKDFAKPGMQKGEAAFLARAKAALGTGGPEEYQQAVETGRGSVASLQSESETGGTLAKMGGKKLTRNQIEQRLEAVLRAQGASQSQIDHAVNTYENPPLSYFTSMLGLDPFSDEARAQGALRGFYQDTKTPLAVRQQAYQQTLGKAALPTTIRIKGQDGRDVPHQVEAAGIPGR